MKSDRSWLSQLIIQPLMIVLSILAALAVNQWQESRARAQRVADARTAFVNEIRSNQELLLSESYLPHHRSLRLEYAQIVKAEIVDKNSFFETGLHPTPLRDSAWRILSGTAVLMDLPPEIVLALSDIYRAQDSLEKRNDGFINAIVALPLRSRNARLREGRHEVDQHVSKRPRSGRRTSLSQLQARAPEALIAKHAQLVGRERPRKQLAAATLAQPSAIRAFSARRFRPCNMRRIVMIRKSEQ